MGLEEAGDAPQGRRHACLGDDGGAAAVHHGRAPEDSVAALRDEIAFPRQQRLGRLLHGDGLARQRRLVEAQVGCLDQPSIGDHEVPRLEVQHVAHDDLRGRDRADLPVAGDAGDWQGHPPEGGHRPLRPVLLREADDRVEHDDDGDHGGVGEVADDGRHEARRQEHDDHRVGELAQEQPPGGLRRRLDELVRPVRPESGGGLRRAEAHP